MHYTFGNKLKNLVAAFLFSGLSAGGISALTSPVTADNAGLTISVNRANKGNRLPLPPIAQPTQRDSISDTPIPRHTLLDCEPAFSPIADPGRAHILNYCIA